MDEIHLWVSSSCIHLQKSVINIFMSVLPGYCSFGSLEVCSFISTMFKVGGPQDRADELSNSQT